MITESSIDLFRDDLKEFFDFDEKLDIISFSKKYGEAAHHVYLTDIRNDYLTLAPESRSVIIKELTYEQAIIYNKISQIFHPHLETIYCVLERKGCFISISEFIKAPDCLNYPQRSISLEEAVEQYGCFCERDALIFLCQLCEGLEALHKINLTHSDISPQNILLTDAPAWGQQISSIPPASKNIWVKLIDFDISKEQKKWNHNVTTVMGTTPYAAPEILDFRYPTNRVDIYSLGCILHYMLTGHSLKNTDNRTQQNLFCGNTMRIINKCTTNYENRYKSVSKLKYDAIRGIRLLDSPLPKCFRYIPGFRSHTYWKMMLAAYYYLTCVISFSILDIITMAAFELFVLVAFNLLSLDIYFPQYAHWKSAHPRFAQVLRITASVSLFLIFIFGHMI